MVRRAAVVALLLLGACGAGAPGAPLHLELLVSRAVSPDSYAVRVFGAAVKCGDIEAEPQQYELGGASTCTADIVDSSSACVIAYDVFTSNDSTMRLSDIPSGSRAVFVEALQDGQVVARGCAAVTVSAGQPATASVTVQ